MDVIGEFFGWIVADVLMAPAEWLSDKVWKRHRKQPTWRRVISATWRSIATLLIFLTWFALIIGIPIAIALFLTGVI